MSPILKVWQVLNMENLIFGRYLPNLTKTCKTRKIGFCSKGCSSWKYVNVSPCLCMPLHEKFQRNSCNDAVCCPDDCNWSPWCYLPRFSIIRGHSVESMAGVWRMNWVLVPCPKAEAEVHSTGNSMILKQVHPRKWEMADIRFFAPKTQEWRQSPPGASQSRVDRKVLSAFPSRSFLRWPLRTLKVGQNQGYSIYPILVAQ